MSRPCRIALSLAVVYLSWMAMMAIHESGHVLAAWAAGGRVRRVVLPLAGFSRTDVEPNPSPRLEIWGGPLVGSVIPLLAWLLVRKKCSNWLKALLGFCAGLCLVANGAYLGIGWMMSAGDAADLAKLGTPIWLLIVVGLMDVAIGLYVWHTLGHLQNIFKASTR